MATVIRNGNATKVVEVKTATPANVEVTDLFTAKLTDPAGVEYTLPTYEAAAATVKDVVEGVYALAVAAKAASRAPWTEVTATEDDTAITLTAAAAGIPYTLTLTAVDGGGADTQTFAAAKAAAADGPGVYSSALNWAGDAAPVNDDDVVIPAAITAAIYGTDETAAVISNFTVEAGCAAAIGSPDAYLQLDVDGAGTSIVDFAGSGNGYLDVDNAVEINVTFANTSAGLHLKGLDNTQLNLTPSNTGAVVGYASLAGEVGEIDTVNVSGGALTLGDSVTKVDGATAFDVNQSGGTIVCRSAVATLKRYPGENAYTQDGGNIATLHDFSGPSARMKILTECTITAATLGPDAHLDLTDGEGTVTLTNSVLYSGAKITDPSNRLVRTNASTYKRSSDAYVQVLTGPIASV